MKKKEPKEVWSPVIDRSTLVKQDNFENPHPAPVEDKPEKKVKAVKETVKPPEPVKEAVKPGPVAGKTATEVAPDPSKWHGWATPDQCVDMIDEMIVWLTAGGYVCPFKRE